MKAKIIRVAGVYGMVYINGDKEAGRVLDRNCKPKMWKTVKGAEAYAKKEGLPLV